MRKKNTHTHTLPFVLYSTKPWQKVMHISDVRLSHDKENHKGKCNILNNLIISYLFLYCLTQHMSLHNCLYTVHVNYHVPQQWEVINHQPLTIYHQIFQPAMYIYTHSMGGLLFANKTQNSKF